MPMKPLMPERTAAGALFAMDSAVVFARTVLPWNL